MKDSRRMPCHEIDYEIFGDDMQMVEIELDPGETVIAEAGAMNYLEEGIDFEAKMGDGSAPDQGMMSKLLGAAKRSLSGEVHFSDSLHESRIRQKPSRLCRSVSGKNHPD